MSALVTLRPSRCWRHCLWNLPMKSLRDISWPPVSNYLPRQSTSFPSLWSYWQSIVFSRTWWLMSTCTKPYVTPSLQDFLCLFCQWLLEKKTLTFKEADQQGHQLRDSVAQLGNVHIASAFKQLLKLPQLPILPQKRRICSSCYQSLMFLLWLPQSSLVPLLCLECRISQVW